MLLTWKVSLEMTSIPYRAHLARYLIHVEPNLICIHFNAVRGSLLFLHFSIALFSTHSPSFVDRHTASMADEVKIDKQAFHDRLSHFISAWRADKRSNDALFSGVGSIVLLMGKNEGNITFQKNNAMHV